MAEWLRRWIANPLLFERASSNLATVVFNFFASCCDKLFLVLNPTIPPAHRVVLIELIERILVTLLFFLCEDTLYH